MKLILYTCLIIIYILSNTLESLFKTGYALVIKTMYTVAYAKCNEWSHRTYFVLMEEFSCNSVNKYMNVKKFIC